MRPIAWIAITFFCVSPSYRRLVGVLTDTEQLKSVFAVYDKLNNDYLIYLPNMDVLCYVQYSVEDARVVRDERYGSVSLRMDDYLRSSVSFQRHKNLPQREQHSWVSGITLIGSDRDAPYTPSTVWTAGSFVYDPETLEI
jgi:hypothetical protein